MQTLYECYSNALNYIVVIDRDAIKYCVVDWDCSEKEVGEIIKEFHEGTLPIGNWNDGGILTAVDMEGFTGFKEIAWRKIS